jgi:basic membrane protein A
MSMMKHLAGAAAAIALSAGAVVAEPALIFDQGGKFDKSFNEAAYNGAERWKAEGDDRDYGDVEMENAAQREQFLRRFAEAGNNPIVVTGFAFADVLGVVAPDYPDTKFVIIDGVVDAPNVRSVVFSEHQGSYLTGIMAARASESGTLGFIGGMDIPLIRKFACGYAQGVKATNPDAEILVSFVGTDGKAWSNPVGASENAIAQMSQGADVIYAAAGSSGLGVLQAAADNDILAIGVDSNQNYLQPGYVLTSMLKRVDNAVYEAMTAGDQVETGLVVVEDLASRGVGIAMDEYNEEIVPYSMLAEVYAAAAQIEAGDLVVHDYMSDNTCPALTF